jgi:hypothetical protein
MFHSDLDHFEMGRARHNDLLRHADAWRKLPRPGRFSAAFRRFVYRIGALLIALGKRLQKEEWQYAGV